MTRKHTLFSQTRRREGKRKPALTGHHQAATPLAFRVGNDGPTAAGWAMQVAVMGRDGELVVSSSDDGRVFIWERATGKLVNMLVADEACATVAAPHPVLPSLASAGASGIVRTWSPEVQACLPAALCWLLQEIPDMLSHFVIYNIVAGHLTGHA